MQRFGWRGVGSVVFLGFMLAHSRAAAAQPCPPGQKWHAEHGMCMPLLPEPGASSGGQGRTHEGMPVLDMSNTVMADRMSSPDGCGLGSYFLVLMSMCLPRPRAPGQGMVMSMLNAFFVDTWEQGLRGRHAVAAPNWLMSNAGVDLSRWNRVEIDVMLTTELLNYPARGYP
jgi:hypothetical protein